MMVQVSAAWMTEPNSRMLIRLPMPGQVDWYCIEVAEIVGYESGRDPRRSNVEVRGTGNTLDVALRVEWIDAHFAAVAFWPIQPADGSGVDR